MAVGWSFATQLVDTVCMFLCISICNDTSEQHQFDDTYLQSFGISGIYTAVVYSSMAVPVNSGRYYTTMYRTLSDAFGADFNLLAELFGEAK